MSDSDSTWPATDDFGSRFLEIDELVELAIDDGLCSPVGILHPDTPEQINTKKKNRSVRGKNRRKDDSETMTRQPKAPASSDPVPRSNRSKRQRSQRRSHDDDDSGSDIEEAIKTGNLFRAPKLSTARQLSLHMKRSGIEDNSSTAMTLESIEPSKSTPEPTPEQIAAKQRTIARRRESAKNKVEMQKRQTVERLLKVNTSSSGARFGGKGRVAQYMRRALLHSTSTASLLASAPNESPSGDSPKTEEVVHNAETPTLVANGVDTNRTLRSLLLSDPPADYIRIVSSSRLTPLNRLCLPPSTDNNQALYTQNKALAIPNRVLCSQGCGRLKRYSCSKTGLPLCSLSCYKICLSTQQTNTAVS